MRRSIKSLLSYSLFIGEGILSTVTGVSQTIPVTSAPFTASQPGKYILQNNLTVQGGTAITVSSFSVNIDLNGFTITTNAVPNQDVGINVDGPGISGVVIQNGEIRGFSRGITVGGTVFGASGVIIENVRVVAQDVGLALRRSRNGVIRNCEISKVDALSRFSSNAGIHFIGGVGNRVVNTTVSGSANHLFPVGVLSEESNGNYFEDDYFVRCSTAMSLSPSDKYRSISTTDCPGGIQGGIDVDGASN
jgi:hypothetical protein